jgi:hypothetical protein
MKTRLAAFTLATVLGASGCADNHASIEMLALCAPPEDATECGMAGTCETYLASARPWVSLFAFGAPNGLQMFTEVHNQMLANDDPSSGRVNTNDAIVTGYELDISNVAYDRRAYPYPANFGVRAESSFVPVIQFIPPEIALDMSSRLSAMAPGDPGPFTTLVGVRLQGRLLDGSEFETGTFQIAVDVFNDDFPGFGCVKPDEVVVAVCPNTGQTASVACEALDPPAP